MSVYSPTIDGAFGLCMPVSMGASDAASQISQQIHEGLWHFAEPRVALLLSDIEQIVADSNTHGEADSTPIQRNTAEAAIEFAYLLPRSLPIPEVTPDPDGDISFDWFGPSGKMFSVSVDARGRLAYAGRFAETSKVHGTEQLSENCPQEIIRGIAKTIS
jgi:hypothetical protein